MKVQVSVTKLFRYNPAFLFQTAHSNRYVRSHHEHARWEHEKVAVPSPRPSHFLRPVYPIGYVAPHGFPAPVMPAGPVRAADGQGEP